MNVHPNSLGLMVRVASQERFLTDKKVDIDTLTYTHKASLVKLDNSQKKINLIKKCIEQGMTTRELDAEIKKELDQLSSTKSLSLIQTTRKCIKRVDTVLKSVNDTNLNIDGSELSDMTLNRLENLEAHLKDLKKISENAAKSTASLTSGCDELLGKLAVVKKEKEKNPPKRGRKSENLKK